MIYYKVIRCDEMVFSTTIENDAYFFVINHFIDYLNNKIHNNRFDNLTCSSNINLLNSTIHAINNKEYESAYFFCKDYTSYYIETEDINIEIPIISPKIIKALNTLNKETVFK